MKKVFLLSVFIVIFVLSANLQAESGSYKIFGYISPDFTKEATLLCQGFQAKIAETEQVSYTDGRGYFEMNIPLNQNVNEIRISKAGYLERRIKLDSPTGDVQLGTKAEPSIMWAGDIAEGSGQDNAVNLKDIMKIANSFNRIKGDVKYVADRDFNIDNVVNMQDIMIAAKNFNKTTNDYPEAYIIEYTPQASPTSTPTPTPTLTPTPTPTPANSTADVYTWAITPYFTDLLSVPKPYRIVAVNSERTAAIQEDGRLLVWGRVTPEVEKKIERLRKIKSVALTDSCCIALSEDGRLYCIPWREENDVPEYIDEINAATDIKEVVADGIVVAIKNDGTIVSWGQPDGEEFKVPEGLCDVVKVSTKKCFVMALKKDGTVVSWGSNYEVQEELPVKLDNIKDIGVGDRFAVVLKNDGTCRFFGYCPGSAASHEDSCRVKSISIAGNSVSLLLDDDSVMAYVDDTNDVYRENGVQNIISGSIDIYSDEIILLKKDGEYIYYNGSEWGEYYAPRFNVNIKDCSTGHYLTEDGELITWMNTLVTGSSATPILERINLKGVKAYFGDERGGYGSVNRWAAIMEDGTVSQYDGDLRVKYPTNLDNVKKIIIGTSGFVALKNDGTVFCWKTGGDYAEPVENLAPVGINGIIDISCAEGFYVGDTPESWDGHVLALKSDGTVIAWGENFNGQCNVPQNLKDVISVSAGPDYSLALKKDGTVAAWGNDYQGVLNVPGDLKNVTKILASYDTAYALTSDGRITCWGYKNYKDQNKIDGVLPEELFLNNKGNRMETREIEESFYTATPRPTRVPTPTPTITPTSTPTTSSTPTPTATITPTPTPSSEYTPFPLEISEVNVNPGEILTNEAEDVIFTADIVYDHSAGTPYAVVMYVDLFGNAKLGDMRDDGKDGDAKAGDGIFTLKKNMVFDVAQKIYFEVIAGQNRLEHISRYLQLNVLDCISDEDMENNDKLQGQILERYSALIDSLGVEKAKETIMSELYNNPDITDAGLCEDSNNIWIEHKNGVLCSLTIDRKSNTNIEKSTSYTPQALNAVSDTVLCAPPSTPPSTPPKELRIINKKVLLLSPMYYEFKDTDDHYLSASNPGPYDIIKKYSYNGKKVFDEDDITFLKNNEVTVKFLREELYKYGIISIATHGGSWLVNKNKWEQPLEDDNWVASGQVSFLTGQTTRDAVTLEEKRAIRKDLAAHRIAIDKNKETGINYYIILPSFIKTYFKNTNANNLVLLGACLTGNNDAMANAFLSRGVATYVAPIDSPMFEDARNRKKRFLECFLSDQKFKTSNTGDAQQFAMTIYNKLFGSESLRPPVPIVDLGKLKDVTCPLDINNKGQVVGYSEEAIGGEEIYSAFLWENGVINDIGYQSIARAINDAGTIVGETEKYTFPASACKWQNGIMSCLDISNYSVAYDINKKGQIVGTDGKDFVLAEGSSLGSPEWERGGKATMWYKGKKTILNDCYVARSINDYGVIVGHDRKLTDNLVNVIPFIVENGISYMADYGGYFIKINNKGQIAAYLPTKNDSTSPFLLDNGEFTNLGTLGGDGSWAVPTDINNKGQIVGAFMASDGQYHPFFWEKGVMTDLTDMGTIGSIDNPESFGSRTAGAKAYSINDFGQIVGMDLSGHAVIWQP